jgi:type II secretory pathway pseudopilin PulG
MKFDIFVSYSSKDKLVADAIVAALEGKNLRCWYAPRDIKPGSKWAESITEAISRCRLFLLIFSQNSNKSSQVLDEISYAISEEKTIIPFRIENLNPSGAMRLHLSSRHWLDAYDPSWKDHIDNLVSSTALNLGVDITPIVEPEVTPLPIEETRDVPQRAEEVVEEVGTVEEIVEAHHPSVHPAEKRAKKPPWLWIGITGVLVVTLIFVLGVVLGPRLMGVKTQSSAEEANQSTAQELSQADGVSEPTDTITPNKKATATSEPTPEPDPQLQAAKAFADPIFAYARNTSPTFEEDFSTPQEYWQTGTNSGDFAIIDLVADGVMRFDLDAQSLGYDRLNLQYNWEMLTGDEVLFQFDFSIPESNFDQMIEIFKTREPAAEAAIFGLDFRNANWAVQMDQDGEWVLVETGPLEVAPGEANTLKLLNNDGQSAVYVNDELLIYFEEPVFSGSHLMFGFSSSSNLMMDIDNIKFWNLDQVTLFDVEDNPFSYVFNYTASTPPTFSEDFSTPQFYWASTEIYNDGTNGNNMGEYVSAEVLRLHADADDETMLEYYLNLESIQGEDIILVFDFFTYETKEESGVQIHKGDGTSGRSTILRINLGRETIWEVVEDYSQKLVAEGQFTPRVDEANTLMLVVYQGQSGVFLNGELLGAFESPIFSGEDISFGAISRGSIKIDIDNICFWNLDGVEINP